MSHTRGRGQFLLLPVQSNMVFSGCRDSTPSSAHFTLSPASTDDVARANSRQIDFGGSRLLMLPKELRLEIWAYVLTDPSVGKPFLYINRSLEDVTTSGKRFANSLYKHNKSPEIRTEFYGCIKFSDGASDLDVCICTSRSII